MTDPLRIFHFDFNFISMPQDYVRTWLRRLAAMGFNAILWELEDKVEWETCPECVHPEAMSKQQFGDLLAYSREQGLESIPLLQTFGHAEYVLMKEKYRPLRENPAFHDCYCTSNPETRKFLTRLVNEYLDLFGDLRYFHLGGDEAYRFATCPDCKERAAAVGRNHLYAEHLAEVADPIFKRGIRAGVWCDMILAHPAEMDSISREYLIWDWNYWDGEESLDEIRVWGRGLMKADAVDTDILRFFPEIKDAAGKGRPFYTTDMLRRNGYDVVLCSSSRSGGDSSFCGRSELHGRNVVGAARKVRRDGLLGHCVTSWAIRLFNYEIQAPWIRLAILADQNPGLSYDDLALLCSRELFQLENRDLFTAMDLICRAFWSTHSESMGIQWNNLKDGLSAPRGYISGLLKGLKKNGTFAAQREQLESSWIRILKGADRLNQIAGQIHTGHDIVQAWQRAAFHQIWRCRAAQQVFSKAAGDGTVSIGAGEMLRHTKFDYRCWSSKWMTPLCADHISHLAFDPLIEYMDS